MFPADEPHKYGKALASGADAVSADLEDSIPPDQKETALQTLLQWLRDNHPSVDFHVRINKGSRDFQRLQEAGALEHVSAVVIPKVESVEDILKVTSDFPVFAIIEEAKGVVNVENFCALPNVRGVILGRSDMSRALGLTDRISDLSYIRQRMAVAAHAFGKQCLDCCHIVKDTDYIRRTWKESASFGVTGGACLHPSQVPIAREIFTPSEPVLNWCRDAVVGYDQRKGRNYIHEIDGGIVGLPHKRAADKILKK
jgi:citrate lyase subunit beta / citryl-CoA lyase